jgi:hypothetical protein
VVAVSLKKRWGEQLVETRALLLEQALADPLEPRPVLVLKYGFMPAPDRVAEALAGAAEDLRTQSRGGTVPWLARLGPDATRLAVREDTIRNLADEMASALDPTESGP